MFLALFVLAFRKPVALFAVTFLPVALGVLYGFGIYAIFSRSVTPLTAVIGAVLAGIGIDYSIFYLVHYQERRGAGLAPVDAATDTIAGSAAPLVAAWVTSVVGFIAIVFASVPALRDFSIVGSLGLAGALLGAIFLLPALLVLLDRFLPLPPVLRGERAAVRGHCIAKQDPLTLTLSPGVPGKREAGGAARLSMRPLLRWIDGRFRSCVMVSSILMVMMVGYLSIAGPRLGLESDPTVLHPRPNPPLDARGAYRRAHGQLARFADRPPASRFTGAIARRSPIASTERFSTSARRTRRASPRRSASRRSSPTPAVAPRRHRADRRGNGGSRHRRFRRRRRRKALQPAGIRAIPGLPPNAAHRRPPRRA